MRILNYTTLNLQQYTLIVVRTLAPIRILKVSISSKLHNLYSSPHIIRQMKSRRMRWAGHVARMGEGRKVDEVLVGKPEGKRPRHR
jgi:hypothetical protein